MNFLAIPKEPVIPKVEKLRLAAQHYDCVLCGKDKRFTVGAHCDELEFGKGAGKKTIGALLAYVCGDPGGCHDKIDGRAGGLSKEEKRELWRTAFMRTFWIWIRDGWLVVK
jgi:hypothetical protein